MGGAVGPKYVYGLVFIALWATYITLSCWKTLQSA